MTLYFVALASYILGCLVYFGGLRIGLSDESARFLACIVGVTPPVLVIRDWLLRLIARIRAWRDERDVRAQVAAAQVSPPAPAWTPNVDPAEPQPRAILCRRCGAAMATMHMTHDFEIIQCSHCRWIDEVPREAEPRLAFLRARAAELRARTWAALP